MKYILLIALSVFVSSASANAAGIGFVPVAGIAGQSVKEIENTLGKAENCQNGKYGKNCTYKDGAVEITFIGGKADWFTIYPTDNTAYSDSSLSVLGLSGKSPPSTKNSYVMKWEGIEGLKEVSIFPLPNGYIDYFYIKAKTP